MAARIEEQRAGGSFSSGQGAGPSAPPSRRAHSLIRAAIDLPLRAVAGFGQGGGSARRDQPPLPVDGERRDLVTSAGRLAYYVAGPTAEGPEAPPPLLLIHSINAAGSAYEVKPIFDRIKVGRTVYALDLPGYGFSDRVRRLYLPRLMTDAILALTREIALRHGGRPIDALAVSLSSEFLARAASEHPHLFRSVALISPTGFDSRRPRRGPAGSNRGKPALYKTFTFPLWRRAFFNGLTSRVSIRYFLEKTWGSTSIDEGLLNYDVMTTRQPGAEHAPFSFISGFLFSNDISAIYASLACPVLMVHGVRGDFVDYGGQPLIEGRPNWTIRVMDTGALPHFERPTDFMACYVAFLSGA